MIIIKFNYFISIRILQYDKLMLCDNNDDTTENSFLYYVL